MNGTGIDIVPGNLNKVLDKVAHAHPMDELNLDNTESPKELTPEEKAKQIRYIYLDIETYADFKDDGLKTFYIDEHQDKRLKDPDKIMENRRNLLGKAAISPFTGKVITIGMLKEFFDNSLVLDQFYLFGEGDKPNQELLAIEGIEKRMITYFQNEKDILNFFWKEITQLHTRFITFNGTGFDIPFLVTRSMFNDVKIMIGKDYLMELSLPNKYQMMENRMHIDLNMRFDCSLAFLSYYFGVSDDFTSRGSEIAGMYEQNDYLGILGKNMGDLVNLQRIFNKIKDNLV